jgi:chorismate mutase
LSATQVIALLNSLSTGDLDALRAKLDEAARACDELGRADLASALAEAKASLDAGDPRTFRRRVEMVVSKLGHLR